MIRINLLPPEITAKRRAERYWGYIVWATAGVFIVLGVFFFVMVLQVKARESEVAARVQEAVALQTQASSFKVFEDRQQDLKVRRETVQKALAGRAEWSKLFNELSLVLPSDVWLTSMRVEEKRFTMQGQAADSVGDVTSSGFKPIAKLLVHMADVQLLENVWLETSSMDKYEEQSVIKFTIAADIVQPAAASTSAVAPAPPVQP